jgi:predicted nucleic acid-binding protein
MSGSSYVLDTNIISFFLNGDANLLSYFNYTNIHISFITELELKSISSLSKNDITSLEAFLQTCIITDINTPIKNAAIAFRKNFKLKLPDAIVAATASYLGYELVTADKVFNKLPLPIIFYSK